MLLISSLIMLFLFSSSSSSFWFILELDDFPSPPANPKCSFTLRITRNLELIATILTVYRFPSSAIISPSSNKSSWTMIFDESILFSTFLYTFFQLIRRLQDHQALLEPLCILSLRHNLLQLENISKVFFGIEYILDFKVQSLSQHRAW